MVKKWVEDQSWKTEYACLNMPEALRLGNREEVEKHFRENHLANIIKPVDTCTLTGTASRSLRCPQLARLARLAAEDQRRFPLQIATVLSQQFATRGLQFFKVNKTVTHVSVARPLFLDLEATPVSDGVKRIVQHINSHPKRTRRQLFEALAPAPAPAPIVIEPTASGSEPVAPAAQTTEPTPEQTAVIADLHWLIHQGHVIEFASGILETAKRPIPRPPKPEPKPAAKPATPATAEVSAPTAGAESGAGVESVPAEAASTGATEFSPDVEVEEMPGSESAPTGSTESAAPVPCAEPETTPDALPDPAGQAPAETPPPASPA